MIQCNNIYVISSCLLSISSSLCPVQYNCSVIDVQVLVNHYERCGRYYGSGGWGSHGSATEEEKRLTMMLFSGIFDSLAQRVSIGPRIINSRLPTASVQNILIDIHTEYHRRQKRCEAPVHL